MQETLLCWKCGVLLDSLLLPIGRRDECPACHADLHVCLMCEFYDKAKNNQCREPVAEAVRDKDRSNFCDYFKVAGNAHNTTADNAAENAHAELKALFGMDTQHSGRSGSVNDTEAARQALEDLFDAPDKEKPGGENPE